MFDSGPGVFRLAIDNARLPAAGLVALLDVLDIGPDHVRILAGFDADSLDDISVLTVVEIWHRIASWVAAQEQRAIVRLAGAKPAAGDDWSAEELGGALHLAPTTAAKRIDVARQLTARLADTWRALEAGAIPYWHAAHLADALADHTDDVAAVVQDAVLPRAGRQTGGQFRLAVAKSIAAADPATHAERHALAAKTCTDVEVWAEPDGMAALLARGPAPAIYEMYDAIAWRAARDENAREENATVANDTAGAAPEGIGQRRFAALGGFISGDGGHSGADDSTSGTCPPGARRHVGVLLDLPTALGLADHPGEIPGYGPIPAAVAREFAAGADWQAWLTDAATGYLAGLGTPRYRPTPRLREYIEARDRTCRHPGCARPAWRCDIDHGLPYDAGGCTDPANCGCFCRRHHRVKHDPDWHLEREPDGTVHVTTPRGKRHTVPPIDYEWMLHPPVPRGPDDESVDHVTAEDLLDPNPPDQDQTDRGQTDH